MARPWCGSERARVGLSLGGVLTVSDGTGFFLITPNGVAGSLSASVALEGVAGVSFSGTFAVADQQHRRPPSTRASRSAPAPSGCNCPPGRTSGSRASAISLTIAGQTLSGNVAFERFTRPNGTTFVRVGLNGVRLAIGDGTNDLLTVSDGAGSLVITPAGHRRIVLRHRGAQRPRRDAQRHHPRRHQPHRSARRRDVRRRRPDSPRCSSRPATYLRVIATGVDVGIAGLRLSGNFLFEQGTTPAGLTFLRIGMTNVEIAIGDGGTDLVRVTVTTGEPRGPQRRRLRRLQRHRERRHPGCHAGRNVRRRVQHIDVARRPRRAARPSRRRRCGCPPAASRSTSPASRSASPV